jgi:hypothetical protein
VTKNNPFAGLDSILVQFKVSSGDISCLPKVVRHLDDETDDEAEDRLERNENGKFAVLMRKNGVVGGLVTERLAEAGLKLVHVYAQRRRKRTGFYGLITFKFSTEHETAKPRQEELAAAGQEALLKQLARRWGEVRLVEFHDKAEPFTVLVFASPAAQPIQSRVIEDEDAAAAGITLTASVPKHRRGDVGQLATS